MKSPFPCPWTWDLGMSVLMRANELLMVLACVNWGLEGKFGFICAWKWKWSDIRLSMVTHTRNSCSAFNPFKVHTHSSEHTHREHTLGAVGSHLCCSARGAVGCLVQGHLSCGIEDGESAGHSHTPPTIPASPRLEPTTFGLRVWLSNH